jgi:hypothetical protein
VAGARQGRAGLDAFLALDPPLDEIEEWLRRSAAEEIAEPELPENVNRVGSLFPPPEPTRLHPATASSSPDPIEPERLRAQITAEIYTTLAAGLLPMAADAMAAVRIEAADASRRVGDELIWLRELERAQRVVAAAEERQVEAEEEEELATFREQLRAERLGA